jgi:eukaryotic-like serine/threonine-protein kinase
MKTRPVGSKVLNRYEIIGITYSGNMSNVYKAKDLRLQRVVCVKEMDIGTGSKKDLIRYNSLINEAAIMKQLSFYTIPRVMEFFTDPDTHDAVYIMDWIDGETTQSILKRQGVLPVKTITKWGLDLCRTLGYLHNTKTPTVYRDLKPSNIMIEKAGTPSEKLFLIDFGAAAVITPEHQNQDDPIGTPGYAHPDQKVRGAKLSTEWDIHALGVLLFTWYTGHSPVERVVDKNGKSHLMSLPVYDINEYSEQINEPLRKIILNCTKQSPSMYHNIEEVQRDLEHLDDDTQEIESKAHRNIRASIALLVTGAVITVGAAGTLIGAQGMKASKISNERQSAYSLNTPEAYVHYLNDDPEDIQGYLRLVKAQTRDGAFTDKDAKTLTNMVVANMSSLQKSPEFPQLAKEIGEAYFYYYDSTDNLTNYQLALQWLNRAQGIKSDTMQMEILICEFQSNIQAQITSGSDSGKYGSFYQRMESSKIDNYPELLKAMYYKTLVNLVNQYSYQLKQDGITKEQMQGILDTAQSFINKESHPSSRVAVLIDDMKSQIASAGINMEQVFSGRAGV